MRVDIRYSKTFSLFPYRPQGMHYAVIYIIPCAVRDSNIAQKPDEEVIDWALEHIFDESGQKQRLENQPPIEASTVIDHLRAEGALKYSKQGLHHYEYEDGESR